MTPDSPHAELMLLGFILFLLGAVMWGIEAGRAW